MRNGERQMQKYKMMVLDLDGTLLNGESQLEQKTKEALQEIMWNGKKVTLCSSRSFEEMRTIIEELYPDMKEQYCIGFGGACVYGTDGSIMGTGGLIERENAERLIEDANLRNIHIHGYDEHTLYYYQETEAFRTFLAFADVKYIPMERLSYQEFLLKGYLKLMCLGDRRQLEDYDKKASQIACTAFSNPAGQQGYLDICRKNVSKKTGVALLCANLGISKEECICVGDGENDIPMLNFAGLGIAMKNAGTQVKKAADYVSCHTNLDYGVYYLVKKFMV